MFKNKTQCLLDIALISSFLYNIYLSIDSPCSYTAKFVLDLLELPKGRFSHMSHMSKIIQYDYSYRA